MAVQIQEGRLLCDHRERHTSVKEDMLTFNSISLEKGDNTKILSARKSSSKGPQAGVIFIVS